MMIYLLEPRQYALVRPLLDEMMDIHLSIVSLLQGLSPGRVYVDYPDQPRSVFGWSMHRLFLAGQPDNRAFNQAVTDVINQEIYPADSTLHLPHFGLHFSSPQWEQVIPGILAGTYPVRDGWDYYTIQPGQLLGEWRSLIPGGFNLWQVDQTLLEQSHLEDLAELKHELCSERPSVEDFLGKSFGFCLVRDNQQIISWCLSEYNSASRCEVGIETQPDYQRRGFATITASALVEHAFRNGITQVGWHCYSSNLPSGAAARKVGFQLTRQNTEYWAVTDRAVQMALQGNLCLRESAYAEAADWFQRAFAEGNPPAWAYYNAACAYAYLNKEEQVFKRLNQAVDLGYRDLQGLQDSSHLAAFHDTAEWGRLLARLKNH
jgi:RimJ/RimL family protein N-acetyltransferase